MDQHLTMIPAIFDFSSWHLLVLLVIMLLLFGSRLPQLMRNLGSSVNEFKKGMEASKHDPAATPPHVPEGTVSRTEAPPAQQNNPPPKA